jgi:hypothetical protein
MINKDEKILYIKYYKDNTDYEIKVKQTDKISSLKLKIESILDIKLKRVIVKKCKRNSPMHLEENNTVHDYHLRNGDTIIVGADQVHGGLII